MSASANRRMVTARQRLTRRDIAMVLVCCGGVALSVMVFLVVRGVERGSLQHEFNRIAEGRARALQEKASHSLEALQSIDQLYRASREVERDAFRAVVEDLLPFHPELQALEWVPRVRDAQRAAYEEAARSAGDQDFQFTQQDAQGRLVSAARRETYVPAYFVEPFDANRMIVGLDYASLRLPRDALERARDTGAPAATEWFPLIRAPGHLGVIIFLPIYQSGVGSDTLEERRQHLKGFTAAVLRMDRLIEASMPTRRGGEVDLSLDEEGMGSAGASSPRPRRPRGVGLEWTTTIEVAGSRWLIRCRSTPEFAARHRRDDSWWVLVIMLLLTLLGAGYLRLASRRSAHIERLVIKRTAELHKANKELSLREALMRSLVEDLEHSKHQLEGQSHLLQVSNKRLEELAALKDEVVAKVSHELRTPLTSIKEGLNLMLDNALGQTTADQQDFLRTMDNDVDRLTELINNMLDISKIEAGRMRLTRVRVGVSALIQSLMRSYTPLLGGRILHVECRSKGGPEVFVDRNRMTQVLTNLLSNAMKVTPEQGGTITFRVAEQDGMVAIGVSDSGPGIPAEDLSKLFQKFSQLGATRIGGTGLGLVVCKELTELHGGRIEVTSEVGRGSTFTVLLPAYTDTFALRESFNELAELIPLNEGQTVSLLAIQAEPLLAPGEGAEQRQRVLEPLAEDVRRHLHRGDIVLVLEPSWILVLVLAHAQDVPSILTRLRGNALKDPRLRVGLAVSPAGGSDAGRLFDYAASRLDQEPVVLT